MTENAHQRMSRPDATTTTTTSASASATAGAGGAGGPAAPEGGILEPRCELHLCIHSIPIAIVIAIAIAIAIFIATVIVNGITTILLAAGTAKAAHQHDTRYSSQSSLSRGDIAVPTSTTSTGLYRRGDTKATSTTTTSGTSTAAAADAAVTASQGVSGKR
jgi:hypothetical protein